MRSWWPNNKPSVKPGTQKADVPIQAIFLPVERQVQFHQAIIHSGSGSMLSNPTYCAGGVV